MRLNHANLVVQNLSKATALFQKHFSFRLQEVKGDNALAILNGVDGFILVLMSATLVKGGDISYPKAFHIGFLLDNKALVLSTWHALKSDGIAVGRAPAKIRDTFGFYFEAEGIIIEVSASGDDTG